MGNNAKWPRSPADINIDLMKRNIPLSKSSQDSSKTKPIMSRTCIEAIRNKRKKWLKYKYSKTNVYFNQYKAARNQLTYEMNKPLTNL